MECFFSWFSRFRFHQDKPWLVLGKGPSFSRCQDYDLNSFHLLSLNHAVRYGRVAIAHLIDLDVLEGIENVILENAEVLVLPWHPHVRHKSSPRTLADHLADFKVLRILDAERRLLWYNLQTNRNPNPESPVVVPVRYFSAEAAINLLALGGVRRIRTLGVDGGKQYSDCFEDLKGKTLLANGRVSFDAQFSELARSVHKHRLDFGPLDGEVPVRVFVGATEEQLVPTRVLAHSIHRHASISVQVTPLCEVPIPIPQPLKKANRPRTPFTFQRFLIPEAAGYVGRAIYLDSDMLVFRDIRSLWTLPFGKSDLLSVGDTRSPERRPQFSVMLLDCGALDWDIRRIVERLDSGELNYESLVYRMEIARNICVSIPPEWNSLEDYYEGKTALLHYTDMNRQPWVCRDNPLGHLWGRALLGAIEDGFLDRHLLNRHVEKGWIRPSLLYQVDHGIEDSRKLPWRAVRLDRNFVAPYLKYSKSRKRAAESLSWAASIRTFLARLPRVSARRTGELY